MESEIKFGFTEFIAAAARVNARRRGLIQRLVVNRLRAKGLITEAEAEELLTKDWQSFLEYLIEHLPQILDFIMMLISLFGGI